MGSMAEAKGSFRRLWYWLQQEIEEAAWICGKGVKEKQETKAIFWRKPTKGIH